MASLILYCRKLPNQVKKVDSVSDSRFELVQDSKGVLWDLVLYIPTFTILLYYASVLWYGNNQPLTYVLVFASTLIFLIAFNRIAKSRLMLLASSAIAFAVSKKGVKLELKSGDSVDLVKDVRFFSDMAGRSFAVSGVDASGKTQKFVFHLGQFPSASSFENAKALLRVFK